MATGKLIDIEKSYGHLNIIRKISLDIEDGELLVFVGPSGCGKSTLLRMIAGLEEIDGGLFLLDGAPMNDVASSKRGIAMVFQSYALYPHMTVRQNLSFGLETAKLPRAEIEAAVARASRTLRIEHLLERKPRQLSGGQRQRVAIGRAIVRQPRMFLFDEPLSNLDAELRNEMRVELVRLQKELGTTTIYVTHDQIEAMTMADRIVVLRDGIVEQVGTPIGLYENPANRFVAGFIGAPRMNFMSARAIAAEHGVLTAELTGGTSVTVPVDASGIEPGAALTLGIRPNDLAPASGDAPAIRAEILLVEQLGGSSLLHARLADGQEITIQQPGHSAARRGEILALALPASRCHLFREPDGSVLPRLPLSARTPLEIHAE